jgi:hypothetical protein
MPQEQSQKSGEPPIGECAVCHEPVTRTDPGVLLFSPTEQTMRNVHTRCQSSTAPAQEDEASDD